MGTPAVGVSAEHIQSSSDIGGNILRIDSESGRQQIVDCPQCDTVRPRTVLAA